ncbi:MAG: TldD/PmbA family protein [Theionarchaea archaeon]|nr:TldD/PmbA family protein [Theionarchaea archaeon]
MDILETLIEQSPADYTEVRFHKREKNQIALRKSEVDDVISEIYEGVGIRVLHEGSWGFSSIYTTDIPSLKEALKTALKVARVASQKKKEKVYLQDAPPVTGVFMPDIKDPLSNHSLEEKIELCIETDKSVLSHENIRSSFVYYQELVDSKWILTSNGSNVRIWDSKPQFYVGAIAGSGSDLVFYMDAVGNTIGWEIFKKRTPESMVEKATSTALELVKAPYPKGGKATAILDPALVGLLSHEAVGHTMEADLALSGAITKGKEGEKVASEYVTMVDSGDLQEGGWIPVDDEGVKCRDVTLIKDGILMEFLHNRETAYIMDAEPTGNARAWEYDLEPLIRMRNTYIEKRDWKEEEIISETKKGYLFRGAGSGQADANAQFMFEVKEAYTIEKGEVGNLLRSVTMTGNAFEVLQTVDAVGDTIEFDMGSGACGKQQMAKVDGGGPYLRCIVLVGGR